MNQAIGTRVRLVRGRVWDVSPFLLEWSNWRNFDHGSWLLNRSLDGLDLTDGHIGVGDPKDLINSGDSLQSFDHPVFKKCAHPLLAGHFAHSLR